MVQNKKAISTQRTFVAWMEVVVLSLCVLQFIFGK